MRAPWYSSGGVEIRVGHVLDVLAELPAGSIQTCVTSPPYYGLRSYNTAPVIWGGSPDCPHTLEETVPGKVLTGGTGPASAQQVTNAGSQWGNAWVEHAAKPQAGGSSARSTLSPGHPVNPAVLTQWQAESVDRSHHDGQRSATCTRCGAWRGELGSEPLPDCLAWARGVAPCSVCFVCHLVVVFRAVRRVLHDTGTVFCNMGDGYANDAKWGGSTSGKHVGGKEGTEGYRQRRATGLGPKQLLMMPARVALALQQDGWTLRQQLIWCISGGTRVYARTQKGDMPTTLKDIARLRPETIQLWNGERWTQLLGMSETPRETAIEITLRSGERIGCTPHHEWPTQRGLVRADALEVGDVIQTCKLPMPDAPRNPTGLDDRLVGWFIGAYLANGSRDTSGTIQVSGHVKHEDRFRRLHEFATAYHGTSVVYSGPGLSACANMNGRILLAIVDTYLAGDSAATKRLTNACWQRSDEFLRALLDGYLEGDGHYETENDRWRLGFTRNYALEADLRTLCARLGISIRLKPTTSYIGTRGYPSFRGSIRLTRPDHHNVKQDGEVMALGRSRGRKFWHVGVADAPHLFALGSGVLTSNSKPNPMPESVTDRCTTAHEYVYLLAKKPTYYFDAEAIKEQASENTHSRGNGIGVKNADIPFGLGVKHNSDYASRINEVLPTRNKRSVWTIPTESFEGAHFATFPRKLVEPCVLSGTSARGQCPRCGAPWRRETETTQQLLQATNNPSKRTADPENGWDHARWPRTTAERTTTGWAPTCACDAGDPVSQVVCDPFSGSGTTLYVARHHGRRAVGIELNLSYAQLAADRLRQGTLGLAVDTAPATPPMREAWVVEVTEADGTTREEAPFESFTDAQQAQAVLRAEYEQRGLW